MLASLSVERRRLVESGATSLFKGSLIASGATSKGHRGSRRLLRRRKVPSDRNMISFYSVHKTQIRHSVCAGASLPGGAYEVQ